MASRGKKKVAAPVIGLIVIALFGAAMVLAATATRGLPFATTTTVKAAFHEIGSLRSGDDVRIASTRVGQVESVEPGDGEVVVTMRLDGERPVYRNASAGAATVSSRSTLGQKFVDLRPGTPDAGELGPDDVVPAASTAGSQELADLFPIFDDPTRAAMRTTLQETGGGLAGHEQDVHDLVRTAPEALPALGTVSRTLATEDGARLTSLMQTSDRLATRFADRQDEISRLLGSTKGTLDAVGVDGGRPLQETLDVAPAAMRDTRAALDSLNTPLADTDRAMADLRPGGEALGAATPDVRGVLREAVTPLDKVPGVSDSAEPALRELTPAASDLRPVAKQLARTLDLSAEPMGVLAPYAPEISGYFNNATSALSNSDPAGHWLRIVPMVRTETVTGVGPPLISDPTTYRNPYPEPGTAQNDRRPTPLSGERN